MLPKIFGSIALFNEITKRCWFRLHSDGTLPYFRCRRPFRTKKQLVEKWQEHSRLNLDGRQVDDRRIRRIQLSRRAGCCGNRKKLILIRLLLLLLQPGATQYTITNKNCKKKRKTMYDIYKRSKKHQTQRVFIIANNLAR